MWRWLGRLVRTLFILAAALAAVGAVWVVITLRTDRPVTYEDIQEHFKYGSIGSEPGGSLLTPVGGVLPPYWVFRSLPSICSDKLPGGYAQFGFVSEPGRDLPIGVSRRRRSGIDHVGLNCAVCHTSTLRDGSEVTVSCAEGAEGRVYAGRLRFEIDRIDASRVPETRTQVMLIVGDPGQAFAHAAIPNAGIGLARIEFIITTHIGIHPMAIVRYPHLEDAQAVKEIAKRIGLEA